MSVFAGCETKVTGLVTTSVVALITAIWGQRSAPIQFKPTPTKETFDNPTWVVLKRFDHGVPMSNEPPCCAFCFNHDVPLFEGGFDPPVHICAFCANRALAEITPQPVPEPTPPPERPSKEARLSSIPSPKSLVAHLDQHGIGHDVAKRRLALGVSNHFKRLVDVWDRDDPDPIIADADLRNVRIEKSNILLIGPSGRGKTHLVRSLASFLNVPLVVGDATSLTEAGYVGEDVESLLSRLLQSANGEIASAQGGIVYINEIDKIKTIGSGYKDMRLGVQHALLKILEGCIATVPPEGGYKHPMQPGISSDTTNVWRRSRCFLTSGCAIGYGCTEPDKCHHYT